MVVVAVIVTMVFGRAMGAFDDGRCAMRVGDLVRVVVGLGHAVGSLIGAIVT